RVRAQARCLSKFHTPRRACCPLVQEIPVSHRTAACFTPASVLALALAMVLALLASAHAQSDIRVNARSNGDNAGAANASGEAAYRVLQKQPDRLITQLPNGLIVIAQELRTAPVVSAQVWVKTGSIYEQEFVGAGLSHYLEHLVSGGSTDKRT